MLRARRWSSDEGAWQHAPLLAAESRLAEGEAIFRISFWKSLRAAKSHMGCRLWSEMYVLQRVREDHPFFNGFQRTDDDFLAEAAWLYWQTSTRAPNQDWSRDGIAKRDIEVFDPDGQWRALPDSTLMANSQGRLERKGFRPHYFMTGGRQPGVVYWSSRLLTQPSGDTDVALLLQHPSESNHRIYHTVAEVQAIVDQFLQLGGRNVPAERLRLFAVDEGRHTFDTSHLLEIPLSGGWKPKPLPRGWSVRFPWQRSTQRYHYAVTVAGTDDWRWHQLSGELGAAVLSAFELPTLAETLRLYVAALEGAGEAPEVANSDTLRVSLRMPA